jgi:hypothetical protein
MRFYAMLGTVAFVLVTAPTARAVSISPHALVQILPDEGLAYAKKGGKGWKGGKKARWGGPPPWAPAHGFRRKRGW